MAQAKRSGPNPRSKSARPRAGGPGELEAQEAAAAALTSMLEKIAALDEPDKTNAERIHGTSGRCEALPAQA
jgi:hypothetical protein